MTIIPRLLWIAGSTFVVLSANAQPDFPYYRPDNSYYPSNPYEIPWQQGRRIGDAPPPNGNYGPPPPGAYFRRMPEGNSDFWQSERMPPPYNYPNNGWIPPYPYNMGGYGSAPPPWVNPYWGPPPAFMPAYGGFPPGMMMPRGGYSAPYFGFSRGFSRNFSPSQSPSSNMCY